MACWRPPPLALLTIALFASRGATAASEPERTLSPDEIAAWLDARGLPKGDVDKGAKGDSDVPARPPRARGFVLESSVGVIGHLGPMKNISPAAPWFHVQFGFEALRWLMLFAEGDLTLASTSYAHRPPPPRTYALYGIGAGLRLTVEPVEVIGLYLQGSVGGARVSEDVLLTYGYRNADTLNAYLSAELGLEWYQVSPHFALGAHGGIRSYGEVFEREYASGAALAWVSGVSLRYAF